MTARLRTWSELVHEARSPGCLRRAEHRRLMRDRLDVLYPEPTEAEVDAWLLSMLDEGEE